MDKQPSESKSARILSMYARLNSGYILRKGDLAEEYHVTERSIQRDIDSLRDFLDKEGMEQSISYVAKDRGYKLIDKFSEQLSNNEVLAVCKILLESRSMIAEEMFPILDKIIEFATPKENQQAIKLLVSNEKHHYIPPHHNRPILDFLWDIGQAVRTQHIIEIEYTRLDQSEVRRCLKPVGIMFSEYYFYLTAFQTDDETRKKFDNPDDIFPTIYRIDRIQSVKVLNDRFYVPYTNRFEEGEFRKRVQFMYGGTLQHIKFRFTGPSIEAVLDRLPTAEIIAGDRANGFIVEAEVFGKGYEMWVRSQGDYISELEHREMRL